MTVAEKAITRRPVTLLDCDRHVAEWWQKLSHEPKADPAECRQRIDWWLDARLLIMRDGEAEPMED